MADIYDKHRDTFASVSAYVVLKDGKRVATVAFKFPKSGMSVISFVHWIGTEMQRGAARGGGYDRQTAAVACAADRIRNFGNEGIPFVAAARKDDGAGWVRSLEDAGFIVLQAV